MTALPTTNATTAPRGDTALPDALFLVWGPPVNGPRSRAFARALGIEVHHVVATSRRGLLVAPFKYAAQFVMTLWLLARRRPRVVFVQSPPSLAVLCAWLYTRVRGDGYVVDAHSDALQSGWWTRPAWLRRLLRRDAVTTIVTGAHAAEVVRADGGEVMVLPNVPIERTGTPTDLGDGFHVAVVSSFAPDEPLEAIAAAAARLPEVTFHVTGPHSRARHRLPAELPPNLHLTGFLPEDDYVGLLAGAHGVLCLTTRDHTMQRGACEALSLGTPLVTSRWPLLEDWFDEGTVHVEATVDDIAAGIRTLQDDHAQLAEGIRRLHIRRQADWQRSRLELSERLAPRREAAVVGTASTTKG